MSDLKEKAENAVEVDSAATLSEDDAESYDIENESDECAEELDVCLLAKKSLNVFGKVVADKSACKRKKRSENTKAVEDYCEHCAECAAAVCKKSGHCHSTHVGNADRSSAEPEDKSENEESKRGYTKISESSRRNRLCYLGGNRTGRLLSRSGSAVNTVAALCAEYSVVFKLISTFVTEHNYVSL